MNSSGTSKRKKRRTRKYLDEVWKRARFTSVSNNSQDSTGVVTVDIRKGNTGNHNNCITMNRLTLKAFPKAIRSETITRPMLAEIKKTLAQQRNVDDLSCSSSNSGNGSVQDYPDQVVKEYDFCATNMSSCSKIINETVLKNNNDMITQRTDGYRLFSPLDAAGQALRSRGESSVSDSPQVAQSDHGYKLYKEFMNDISTYLKQNSSDFLEDYVVKETKTRLQRLYLKHCKKECNDSILKWKHNNLKQYTLVCRKSILQNPVDYIRQMQLGNSFEGRASYGSASSKLSLSSASSAPAPLSVQACCSKHGDFSAANSSAECEHPGAANSSLEFEHRSVADSSPERSYPGSSPEHVEARSSLSSAFEGAIYDTPDYIFYAHKLT